MSSGEFFDYQTSTCEKIFSSTCSSAQSRDRQSTGIFPAAINHAFLGHLPVTTLSLELHPQLTSLCRNTMVTEISLNTRVKLRDGNEIPILGYGTYELQGKEAYEGVLSALEAGYRHIDCAAWYDNESEVGQAILDFCQKTNTPRDEIFYTTKLKLNNGYDNVRKAIEHSLKACRLSYIDLYLIHGPLGGPKARQESWKAICDFQKETGLLKSIGISTFGVRHIKEIVDSGMPMPVVHQIDLHPFMSRSEIVEYSKRHAMILEAWAPLVRGYRFNHPVILKIAQKYDKQPAQILLRYSLQKDYIPLPKSSSKSRIVSNSHVFDFHLTTSEVRSLDELNENLVTDWDPTECD